MSSAPVFTQLLVSPRDLPLWQYDGQDGAEYLTLLDSVDDPTFPVAPTAHIAAVLVGPWSATPETEAAMCDRFARPEQTEIPRAHVVAKTTAKRDSDRPGLRIPSSGTFTDESTASWTDPYCTSHCFDGVETVHILQTI